MGMIIGIMGESGHGKSTSLRNLDPATTFIIDADQKGLPWRGAKAKYSTENKNYMKSSDPEIILRSLEAINLRAPHIKTIVIDTMNAVMIDEEMRRMKEKGYDKWIDLATYVFNIILKCNELRDDLNVIMMFHCAMVESEGVMIYRILTNGKKLQKINLETKLPILLFAKCYQGESGNQYVFETQSRQSTAKSPMELFDLFEIPNDMAFVLEQIEKYEKGDTNDGAE